MVDTIPHPQHAAGRSGRTVTLHGDLAGILALSLNADRLTGQQKTSCKQEVEESAGFWLRGHATTDADIPWQ